MDENALADAFVSAATAVCAVRALQEQNWLLEPDQYQTLLKQAFGAELRALAWMQPRFAKPQWKILARECAARLSTIVREARRLPDEAFGRFLRQAVPAIAAQIRSEPPPYLANSLYRAFDALDEIFELDYERDRGLRADITNERIYAGSGLGVQTSYSTLLLVLEQIELGSHFIDLGSGYGRVGLVLGLLHPEVRFTGYEYVPHRVEVAQHSARRAGIADHVKFVAQDLAAKDFEIPEADVYYLYDPFTRETYRHVFAQLKAIGRRRAITVAAKGDGAQWFREEIASSDVAGEWTQLESRDTATLHLFKSVK